MSGKQPDQHWKTLDRDLGRINRVELATQYVSRPLVGFGIALAFIVLAGLYAALIFGLSQSSAIIIAAAIFRAYMALNIAANEVANTMGLTPIMAAPDTNIGKVVSLILSTAQ